MVELIVYWMAVFGLTLAITKLYIGKKFRETVSGISDWEFDEGVNKILEVRGWCVWQSYIGRLLRCPACTGFWVGCIIAIFYWFDFPCNPWYSFDMWKSVVIYGLGASAFSITLWIPLERINV